MSFYDQFRPAEEKAVYPAMLHYPYFQGDMTTSTVAPIPRSTFPLFHTPSQFSTVAPLATSLAGSNLSEPGPLVSVETVASSDSSAYPQSHHFVHSGRISPLKPSNPTRFVPHFPEIVVDNLHNPHVWPPSDRLSETAGLQTDPQVWSAIPSYSVQNAGAQVFDLGPTPTYPHLYDPSFIWNSLQADHFSPYVPASEMPKLPSTQVQDSLYQSPSDLSSAHVNMDGADHGKESLSNNGRLEGLMSGHHCIANVNYGTKDGNHHHEHVIDDPAWWWTYSTVADTKSATGPKGNLGLGCDDQGYRESVSAETNLSNSEHISSLKQAASVLADMLANPLSKEQGASNLMNSKLNISDGEVKAACFRSILTESGDFTQESKHLNLDDQGKISRNSQFIPVYTSSSEHFNQTENVLATTSSWNFKCDFSPPICRMKPNSRSESMKQEFTNTLSSRMQETIGSLSGLLEDSPLTARSHVNLSFLDSDRELGAGNQRSFSHHQEDFPDSGLRKVQDEVNPSSLGAFPSPKLDAVSGDKIVIHSGSSKEAPDIMSNGLTNAQVKQEVTCAEDYSKKNSSIWQSLLDLQHSHYEAKPVPVSENPSNDHCKAEPSGLRCHQGRSQGSLGPLSASPEEFPANHKRLPFSPDTISSDLCTEEFSPYSQQSHFPRHNSKYSTSCNSEASSFCLVGESIFNLTEVLLAHGQSSNGPHVHDLRMLQLSIRNLSQYLLLGNEDSAPPNPVCSLQACVKHGYACDQPFSGVVELPCCQGKEAKTCCCQNLNGRDLKNQKEISLELKAPLQRNHHCDSASTGQIFLAESDWNEMHDSANKSELINAGVSVEKEVKEEAEFVPQDVGAVSQTLVADCEVQLQRMKVLLNCVSRSSSSGNAVEADILAMSQSAHQGKSAETGFLHHNDKKENFSLEPSSSLASYSCTQLPSVGMGLQAEYERLQGLVAGVRKESNLEKQSHTASATESDDVLDDHTLKIAMEAQNEATSLDKGIYEEETGDAKKECNGVSGANFDPELFRKMQEGVVICEQEIMESSDQDDNVSLHSKQEDIIVSASECYSSFSNVEGYTRPFECHSVNIKAVVQSPSRVLECPKPDESFKESCMLENVREVQHQLRFSDNLKLDRASVERRVYPDMRKALSRLALLKARPGWNDSCSDYGSTASAEDETSFTESLGHVLYEPRTLLIKEDYIRNVQEPYTESHSIVESSGLSEPNYCHVAKFACQKGGRLAAAVQKIDFKEAAESSVYCSVQGSGEHVEKEQIMFKVESSSESISDLEDAGWENVQMAFLDRRYCTPDI